MCIYVYGPVAVNTNELNWIKTNITMYANKICNRPVCELVYTPEAWVE